MIKQKATKPKKRPAVFLDRDGTIIWHVDLLHKISDMRILPGSAEAIAMLNKLGYLTVIVTNQPVIPRGICTPAEIDALHGVLLGRLAKKGATIDAVYYCPHHPKANIKKYRMTCTCRKPGIGMMLAAAKDHNIDMKNSWMIGDSTRDMQAGNRAKLKMIMVKTGYGGVDPWGFESTPDFVAKNLAAAARIVKKNSPKNYLS